MKHSEELESYKKELKHYKGYNEKENIELLKRYIYGETELINEIFIRNALLVVKCVKKFAYYIETTKLDIMDLIQTGNLALLDAIKTYDFAYNTSFSTWACFLIEKKLKELIFEIGYSITIQKYGQILISLYNNKYNKLVSELGREPTIDELSEVLNISNQKVMKIQMIKSIPNITSLNTPLTEEGEELIQEVEDDKYLNYDKFIQNMFNEETRKFLLYVLQQSKLTERQFNVMVLRYGLLDGKVKSQTATAKILNICKQYVSSIEKTVIQKIINSKYIFELALYTENPYNSLKLIGYDDETIERELDKIKKI